MSHESSPRPGALNVDTITTVRLALQQYAEDQDDGEALQAALRLVSAEARDKSIFPEQLLTTLKDLWYELPKVRAASGPDHALLLQRVVTLCIKEYYSR